MLKGEKENVEDGSIALHKNFKVISRSRVDFVTLLFAYEVKQSFGEANSND